MINKQTRRIKRKTKIRSRINGTASRPRLVVYKSNQHISAQLVDDDKQVTLVSASDLKIEKGSKTDKAKSVGEDIAKKAKTKKITEVVFDRSGYKYHGRVKDLADAAREAGLKF